MIRLRSGSDKIFSGQDQVENSGLDPSSANRRKSVKERERKKDRGEGSEEEENRGVSAERTGQDRRAAGVDVTSTRTELPSEKIAVMMDTRTRQAGKDPSIMNLGLGLNMNTATKREKNPRRCFSITLPLPWKVLMNYSACCEGICPCTNIH